MYLNYNKKINKNVGGFLEYVVFYYIFMFYKDVFQSI